MSAWGAPVQTDSGVVQEKEIPDDPKIGLEDTARQGKYGAHQPELEHMQEDVKTNPYAANSYSAYPENPVHDELKGPNSEPSAPILHEDKHGRPVYEESQEGHAYANYKFRMKDYVLCTTLDPPPAKTASGWQFGRVYELMLEDQFRVKVHDGSKVVVTRNKGQIRALNDVETKQHKKEVGMEIPCWYMAICFPCMILAAPFYAVGCCDGGLDSMGECFEECVECICDPICSCELCECCC